MDATIEFALKNWSRNIYDMSHVECFLWGAPYVCAMWNLLSLLNMSIDSNEFDKKAKPHPSNPPGLSLLTQMGPSH